MELVLLAMYGRVPWSWKANAQMLRVVTSVGYSKPMLQNRWVKHSMRDHTVLVGQATTSQSFSVR